MKKRPGKEEYYLEIAREVARRGTCLRRNFGAVIVSNDQIVSTGYTGAPRGAPNCIDLERCPREEAAIPRGERYELCRSVHAEMNAVIHASRTMMVGATLYLAGIDASVGSPVQDTVPCRLCRRVIINAGIETVVALDGDRIVKHDVADWIKSEDIPSP
ncbi:MAG: cytidine/deoxycytidylate deaminase family protein [bacterium]